MNDIFERQLAALHGGDIEALMENYAPDATVLRFDWISVGAEQIRETFSAYLALKPRLVGLSHYIDHGDTIFYRAAVNLAGETKESIGTMVIRDGKIWRQTAGFFEGSTR